MKEMKGMRGKIYRWHWMSGGCEWTVPLKMELGWISLNSLWVW